MNDMYQNKYLKYKTKYIKQKGGSPLQLIVSKVEFDEEIRKIKVKIENLLTRTPTESLVFSERFLINDVEFNYNKDTSKEETNLYILYKGNHKIIYLTDSLDEITFEQFDKILHNLISPITPTQTYIDENLFDQLYNSMKKKFKRNIRNYTESKLPDASEIYGKVKIIGEFNLGLYFDIEDYIYKITYEDKYKIIYLTNSLEDLTFEQFDRILHNLISPKIPKQKCINENKFDSMYNIIKKEISDYLRISNYTDNKYGKKTEDAIEVYEGVEIRVDFGIDRKIDDKKYNHIISYQNISKIINIEELTFDIFDDILSNIFNEMKTI